MVGSEKMETSTNGNTPRVHEEDPCDVRIWMMKSLQDIDIGVDVSDESLQVCFSTCTQGNVCTVLIPVEVFAWCRP